MAIKDSTEKHDTLHIKKHSEHDLHYYFSQKERAELPARQKKMLRENKAYRGRRFPLIIFLNISIIFVSFFLIKFVLFKEPGEGSLAGYSFVLRQIKAQDKIIASINVKLTSEVQETDQDEASVTFILAENNKKQAVWILLPKILGKEKIVRINLPYVKEEKSIKATIVIGKQTMELSIPVKN